MIFKKLFVLLFSISTLRCAVSPVEQAINNSDYNSFIRIYTNSKGAFGNKSELKKIAQKVLNDRLKFCKENKFSKKDIARITLGSTLSILGASMLRPCKYIYESHLKDYRHYEYSKRFEVCKKMKVENLLPIKTCAVGFSLVGLYGLKVIFDGCVHKDNKEKLKNAAAIKQLLEQ